MAYWFIAPYIRDIPHLNDGQAMSKLIPATERGTMGRTFLTGDAAFKACVVKYLEDQPRFFCSLDHLDLVGL